MTGKMPNVKSLELAVMLRTLAKMTGISEHPIVGISYEACKCEGWSTVPTTS